MSWDEMSFKVKDCPIYTSSSCGLYRTYEMDDWNRIRNESYSYMCGCDLLKHRHVEEYDSNFYAVPNGYSLHPENCNRFVMPLYEEVEARYIEPKKVGFPKPSNFIEYLCQCCELAKLKKFNCLLENKHVKFGYTKSGKLLGLFYAYQRWNGRHEDEEGRMNCLQQVKKAIERYNTYDYTLERYNKLKEDEDARVAAVNQEEELRVDKLNATARASALAQINWTEDDVIGYYESLRIESLEKSELLPCRKELDKYCW